MENFIFSSSVLKITDPVSQLFIAEQEKAMRREEFELSRRRLMVASSLVQELKTRIYYGKEATNA